MNRILVVEDEPRISSFIEKGLTANGFVTSVTARGNDALMLADSGEYDLIILDIGLPDRDGFGVLRELTTHNKTIPVIVLTARDGVTEKVKGLEGGADDYVTKPFSFDELLARVRVRLRGKRVPEQTVLSLARGQA